MSASGTELVKILKAEIKPSEPRSVGEVVALAEVHGWDLVEMVFRAPNGEAIQLDFNPGRGRAR